MLTLDSKELAASGDAPSDAQDEESVHSLFLSQCRNGNDKNKNKIKSLC